jgi:hypothetical protein
VVIKECATKAFCFSNEHFEGSFRAFACEETYANEYLGFCPQNSSIINTLSLEMGPITSPSLSYSLLSILVIDKRN